jgi:hypothetical protein
LPGRATSDSDPQTVSMNISQGFQIEEPELFVHRGMSLQELKHALAGHTLHQVGKDRFSIFCKSLGGPEREVGFEFGRWLPFTRFRLKGVRIFSKPHEAGWRPDT